MSLTATNAQVYKGTAAVTYGSGSGVSGSQLQGTATITYGGAPTSNTALSLPGTSGSVFNGGTFFPSKVDPSASNVFVEAWIYFNSASSPNTLQYIFSVSDSSTEDMGFYVNFTNQANFRVWNTGGTGFQATSAVTLSATQWTHFAGSWDQTNNKVYVFVNGVLGATVASFTGTPRSRSTSSLILGAGNGGTFFPGNEYIQDFRIVKGGIVPATSFTPSGAPFRLNVPSYITGGSTVLSLYEQYFYPSWLNLPGANGAYMALGTSHPANFDTSSTSFFVECWVYLKNIPSTVSTDYYIIQRGTGVYAAEDIGLRILQSGYAEFYSYGAGGTIAIPNTGIALSASTWYHLAGSIVSSTKTVYIFLNGVLKNSASMAGSPRTTTGSNFFIGTPIIQSDWIPANLYVQDIRVVQGGIVPTTSFTPAAAPFGLASPSYVASMGTTVLSLATQYYQTSMRVTTGGTIQFTSRPILPAVLVNPGDVSLAVGSLISVNQTALQPANGITWSLIPSGAGVSISSSTDYVLTLLITSQVSSLFTVVATNKNGLSSVVQFNVSTPLYSMTFPFTFTNMGTTGSAGPTSITYGTSNPGYGTAYAMVLGTSTSAGMQRWTVPVTRSYTFTVAGAGYSTGTFSFISSYFNFTVFGAVGTTTLSLTAGHVIRILVGQAPNSSITTNLRLPGCGGTFVYNETTSTLLAVAGGAGGSGVDSTNATGSGTSGNPYTACGGKGLDASTTTTGGTPPPQSGAGGTSGNGGQGSQQSPPNYYGAAGGGGYSTNGGTGTNLANSGGYAFVNGGSGGTGANNPSDYGGFGGGGACANIAGGGGGGGYSGGGGGATSGAGYGGGGGGSYTSTSWTSITATNSGQGYVIVT